MGTSTQNKGQKGKTPLIPSWLGESEIGDENRFTATRSGFTRYINSNGENRDSLEYVIGKYVSHSLGGAKNAMQRLGAARITTAKLFEFAGLVEHSGCAVASKKLFGRELIGLSAKDFFKKLTDFVCPDGGTTDEGIARDAYIEAIENCPDLLEIESENLSIDLILVVIEEYMTKVIMERLINDVGNKLIKLPERVEDIDYIQKQLEEYIKGSVSDALSRFSNKFEEYTSDEAQKIVDEVYSDIYFSLSKGGE